MSPAALTEAADHLVDAARDGLVVEITATGTRVRIVDAFRLDDMARELVDDLKRCV